MAAHTTYRAMSGESESEDALENFKELSAQASQLAEQTKKLRNTLETFTTTFADDLQSELTTIRDISRKNRLLNVFVFAIVVGGAVLFIRSLLRREIIRPLEQIVETANATAQGDFSTAITIQSQDEIGTLADAFRNMLERYPRGVVACVSDSYDIFRACSEIWGRELRDAVLARD